VIVGDQSTHGKGTVQTVYHLDNVLRRQTVFQGRKPGSLKFTVQKFYRINGGSTQRKGVTPDIVFPAFTDFMELGESELPNSLPWDEIDSLSPAPVSDISPFLDAIKAGSRERTGQDEGFVTFERTVKRYGEIRKMKKVSLNRTKRETMQKEEEALSKKIQQTTSTTRRRKPKPQDDDDAPPPKDYVLEEAVRIAGDLGRLERKSVEAKPVAEAKSKADTPQPAAAATGN
jgi:carboxyl-terminal processing protease